MLLHACCGPCSLEPVRLLQERGIFPVIFYANSNIHPREEYEHRLETLREWAGGAKAKYSKANDLQAQTESLSHSVSETLGEQMFEHTTDSALTTLGDDPNLATTTPDPALLAPVRVIEGRYDPQTWEETAGKIGDALTNLPSREAKIGDALIKPSSREARCRACYRLRFTECAKYAATHGFDTIGTTLSVSPYQYTKIIREELERAASAHDLRAAFEDYTPYYAQATHRSRALGMYRQNYCGCRISALEAEAQRAQRKREREIAKQQKQAQREKYAREHAQEIADAERTREARKRERAAYNKKQARKKQILKQLREQRNQKASKPTE